MITSGADPEMRVRIGGAHRSIHFKFESTDAARGLRGAPEVAGGRGDLSFQLANLAGAEGCVVLDPRELDDRRVRKRVAPDVPAEAWRRPQHLRAGRAGLASKSARSLRRNSALEPPIFPTFSLESYDTFEDAQGRHLRSRTYPILVQ